MTTDAARALRARGLRVTPQRRAILAAFAGGSDEHLSAEEVHGRASAAVPGISRGTVYATLAELTELGLVAAFGSHDPVRYETNLEPHQHFHCRRCLRLFDVELAGGEAILPGYAVERVAMIAVGVCAECGDYERGVREGADDLVARPRLDAAALAGRCLDAPFGRLAVAASADGVVRVAFAEHADFAAVAGRARRGGQAARGHADHAARSLRAYLAGAPDRPDETVDWSAIPARAVLEAAARIPFGALRSYERLGAADRPYELGRALGGNPLPLLFPCHRVSCGSQLPGAYAGGAAARAWLSGFERPTAAAGS
jgi:Fe2+ or Zn2+ uptake regulation protein/O6-methylguanine-DNA--protein-cysteine methyltransferase